jgi:protein ImuA
MSRNLSSSGREARKTLEELREHPGLFSFRGDVPAAGSTVQHGVFPQLGIRPGGIVEWLAARPGAGALTAALQVMSPNFRGGGAWAIVDAARECYVPALTGWGIDPSRTVLLRPATLRETCWAIEQCLRCPGVSATWAWVEQRIPGRVQRRWQLAAEVGGGVGLFFRPEPARREPVWADLRLLVTPQSGGRGESRRVHIEVLYRRGAGGGRAQVWEIDHAAGTVRVVPEVAAATTAERAARA